MHEGPFEACFPANELLYFVFDTSAQHKVGAMDDTVPCFYSLRGNRSFGFISAFLESNDNKIRVRGDLRVRGREVGAPAECLSNHTHSYSKVKKESQCQCGPKLLSFGCASLCEPPSFSSWTRSDEQKCGRGCMGA